MSNSKLTLEQKRDRKEMRADFDTMGDGFINQYPEFGVTIVGRMLQNTMQVAVSIMSPDETKFRRKVGEYHALVNFYNAETIPVSIDTNLEDFAAVISDNM